MSASFTRMLSCATFFVWLDFPQAAEANAAAISAVIT
jgi:hypothetical protein